MNRGKVYLKSGSRVFATGVYLILDDNGVFHADGFEDDTYYEGLLVDTDDDGYYIDD